MPVLKIHSESKRDAVSVPALFIDEYMPQANGEFVKVYLSLLRCQWRDEEISLSALADFLNHTENDVMRALKYWERMGLVKLEYGRPGKAQGGEEPGKPEELKGILLLDLYDKPRKKQQAAAVLEITVEQPEIEKGKSLEERAAREEAASLEGTKAREGTASLEGTEALKETGAYGREGAVYQAYQAPEKRVSLKQLEGNEEFSRFLYVASQYLGAPLSRRDCDTFAYLYEQLGMPEEFLEYLTEYCVSLGRHSVRYIETVALDLHRRGILTVEGAKTVLPGLKKEDYAVMKAFGLNSRQPVEVERQMMDKWFRTYGFSLDIVLEACNRTMAAIHKPSFEYADRILSNWKENDVKTKSDIKTADERRNQEKGNREKGAKPDQTKKPMAGRNPQRVNQFHNFKQRDYDYDALLKQLNQ